MPDGTAVKLNEQVFAPAHDVSETPDKYGAAAVAGAAAAQIETKTIPMIVKMRMFIPVQI
jgi:hypothetical protein